jgi:hypothetical protein
MKKLLILLLLTASPALAININGEYPICTTEQQIRDFSQAKTLQQNEKMIQMVEDGQCVFVEPDIKATVLENNIYPKVVVFVPYKKPITGWTNQANLGGFNSGR